MGYVVVRQRGSHIRVVCFGKKPITIPNYSSIDRSLLKLILNEAGISPEEFMNQFEH